MKGLESLAILTHGYPFKLNPGCFPFVQRFAHAASQMGVRTTVIAPFRGLLPGRVVIPYGRKSAAPTTGRWRSFVRTGWRSVEANFVEMI